MNIKNGILNVPKHGNKHDLIHFLTKCKYMQLKKFKVYEFVLLHYKFWPFRWVCPESAFWGLFQIAIYGSAGVCGFVAIDDVSMTTLNCNQGNSDSFKILSVGPTVLAWRRL